MEAIVAVYSDWGIGCCGTQPVVVPEDRKHFRAVTADSAVIVGRKTLADFPGGRPLKNRVNIVLTRNGPEVEGAVVARSLFQALEQAAKHERVFVIGGESVYRQLFPYVDRVYVTKIEARPDSDAFFHDLDNDPAWQVSDPGEEREHEGIKYRFMVYERTETNRTAALEYLMKDPLKNCGMLHLLQKDGVRVLFAGENGALVYDPESRMHMLSAVFCEETASWLKGLENVEMFSVTDRRHLEVLASELGLTHTMEFRQFVYEKSAPPPYSGTLDICAPTDAEMDVIKANYGALSSDELDYVRSRGRVFAAHDGSGAMVGFIGIHLEGCMGMLEILPEYRRLGYATYLESALIARRLESGAVPFCQVACDNVNSLGLQKKLGLTQAPGSIFFAY